jgi:hypothetical protein
MEGKRYKKRYETTVLADVTPRSIARRTLPIFFFKCLLEDSKHVTTIVVRFSAAEKQPVCVFGVFFCFFFAVFLLFSIFWMFQVLSCVFIERFQVLFSAPFERQLVQVLKRRLRYLRERRLLHAQVHLTMAVLVRASALKASGEGQLPCFGSF